MRRLETRGVDLTIIRNSHSREMPAVTLIYEGIAKNCRMARQCDIDSALPTENRWPHKQKKSYKCGNRISWEAEEEFLAFRWQLFV